MNQKKKVGNWGEDQAVEYLTHKKYKIIDRNYRYKWGDEIDIIAKTKAGNLVFVEVKTLKAGDLRPEDNLDFKKVRKLKRSCQFYANANPELTTGDKGWQIDLIAIEVGGGDFEIRHYENI